MMNQFQRWMVDGEFLITGSFECDKRYSLSEVESASRAVSLHHPFLRCVIEDNASIVCSDEPRDSPIIVRNIESVNHYAIGHCECKNPMDTSRHLYRICLGTSEDFPDQCVLSVTIHHAIADAPAVFYTVRDIMHVLRGGTLSVDRTQPVDWYEQIPPIRDMELAPKIHENLGMGYDDAWNDAPTGWFHGRHVWTQTETETLLARLKKQQCGVWALIQAATVLVEQYIMSGNDSLKSDFSCASGVIVNCRKYLGLPLCSVTSPVSSVRVPLLHLKATTTMLELAKMMHIAIREGIKNDEHLVRISQNALDQGAGTPANNFGSFEIPGVKDGSLVVMGNDESMSDNVKQRANTMVYSINHQFHLIVPFHQKFYRLSTIEKFTRHLSGIISAFIEGEDVSLNDVQRHTDTGSILE